MKNIMKELIEVLEIFFKYKNENFPTHCEHDVLHIVGISEEEVSPEDTVRLNELHFFWGEDNWVSYKYGSA